jgi:mono/diheme cytochrome c family protein
MPRFLFISAAAAVMAVIAAAAWGREAPSKTILHDRRQADSDLEIGGELAGIPRGSARYVSYNDLLKLPQVSYTVSDDSNFSGKTKISGISLDVLSRSLDASAGANLVVAICYDGYRTNYPSAYLSAHRPLLVLKINGKTEANWPKSPEGGSLGPYLISSPAFTPSFKVLSHTDEPQIPFGVTRIEFRNEQTVFGAIAPRGNYGANSPVMNGYRIAQQNCFRCHNMGSEGGQMAGRTWQILAMWASTEPDYFRRYVKNPQSIDAKNRMPAFPQYDAGTIEALRQYFASFAPSAKPRGGR